MRPEDGAASGALRIGMDVSALALTSAGTARHIRSLLDALENEDVEVRRYSFGGHGKGSGARARPRLVPLRSSA